jgi:hypothetical protein
MQASLAGRIILAVEQYTGWIHYEFRPSKSNITLGWFKESDGGVPRKP